MAKEKEKCCSKVSDLFFHPKKFMDSVEEEKNYTEPMFFYVKITVIAVILELIFMIITFIVRNSITLINIINTLTSSVANIGIAFIIPFAVAGIVHLGVLIFKGKQGFFNTYKPITYAVSIGIFYNMLISIIGGIIAIFNSQYIDSISQIASPELLWQNSGFVTLMIVYGIIMLISLAHILCAGTIGLSKYQKVSRAKAFLSIILILLAIIIIGFIIGVIVATYAYAA